ncbi:MAG: hypothetical protein CW338_06990 [Clostridiales bacterium]|nr:hypothetical protein [Clostridiales bacterium]
MKKLIAVILSLAFVFALCVPAMAESGFETLFTLLSTRNENLEEFYLGPTYTIPMNEANSSKICMLWYDNTDNTMNILGTDRSGAFVGATWNNVDFADGVYIIYSFCNVWETLAGVADPGYSIVLGLHLDTDSSLWIQSAAEATAFCSALEGMLD